LKLFQLTIFKPTVTDVFIYSEVTKKEVEAKATRAMRSGHEVTWPNGKSQWFEVHPLFTEDFSYVWHSDGNRIECTEVLKTRGEEDQTIRTKFVAYDSAF
jgi:Tfp pilus assembly major pilin PilA